MLNSLLIKNFRLFSELLIPKLGRVNLIVGENNSGKSCLLEALRIYANQADPQTLLSILGSHDEGSYGGEPYTSIQDIPEPLNTVYRHFFPGRKFPDQDDCAIYIGQSESQKANFVKIEHCFFYLQEGEEVDLLGARKEFIKRIILEKNNLNSDQIPNPLRQALRIFTEEQMRFVDLEKGAMFREKINNSSSYVPTDFLSSDDLAALWDTVVLTDVEVYLIEALRLIEPKVDGLGFVNTDKKRIGGQWRNIASRIPIVKLSNETTPIPLGSMGDGLSRLLQIVLSALSARNGFLLIDEFENGLHYSVQEKAWKLIFELAVKFNIQVFATTHSKDCIEAFSAVASADKEVEGMAFRLGRSVLEKNKGQVVARLYDADDLQFNAQSKIEVR